ncbi:hypothetical protein [Caballeronia sp. GAWG2-1]|uniref:hypothetical protein n=1 Tax=Caballeronia sp. GAWG2-1 TaxID=2921744 RepID=UPI0020282392|nr:hypothetical protein [Caballeronia sp. GAWG2-1]
MNANVSLAVVFVGGARLVAQVPPKKSGRQDDEAFCHSLIVLAVLIALLSMNSRRLPSALIDWASRAIEVVIDEVVC